MITKICPRMRINRATWKYIVLLSVWCSALIAHGLQGIDGKFHAEIDQSGPVPWTALPHVDNPDFRFTIFSDRTGMAYPGAMERAIHYVNQEISKDTQLPAFVLSVGDNIEGYSRDTAETSAMWNSFDAIIQKLRVPFLRLPGNHDISDGVMEQVYKQRYGHPYYAFLIENVLFLMVDTEDGPPVLTMERELEIHGLVMKAAAEGALHPDKPVQLPGQKDPCNAESTHADLGALAETNISDEQLEYFRKVLAEHANARQVVVLMHRPAWRTPRSAAFARLQEMLRGRKYTVFAGHYHQYGHEVLEGADYYILGPTAALPRCVRGEAFRNQLVEVHVKSNHLTVEPVMLEQHETNPLQKRTKEKAQ